ncbi:MAG: hypothetical protein ACE37K_19955 [Planctomycetota bacterium]
MNQAEQRDADLLDDATLVAWLDGELAPEHARRVATRVAQDDRLGARVRLLRSARAELGWALGENEAAPPPPPIAALRRTRWSPIWLLAAAALAVVVTIATTRPEARDEVAENDWLAVELRGVQAGWDLFSDIRFELEGHARTATPCRVVAREQGETDVQLGARALADNDGAAVVPLVLEAAVVDAQGKVQGPVAGVDGTFAAQASALTVRLTDLRVPCPGIGPLLTVRPTPDGARRDFRWGFSQGIVPEPDQRMGLVPQVPGAFRLQLTLRAVPTAAGAAPAFAEPLEVSVGFAVRGVVGAWSAPVDGMRARIVANTNRPHGRPLVVAVQLRNDSDRVRGYNVTGTTLAQIPQPFHFDLLVDGQRWRQRDGLSVLTAAKWLKAPQPVGSIRSVVVLADYWSDGEHGVAGLAGDRDVAIRFHFEPTVWRANDRLLWRGMINTPAIAIRF